MGKIITLAVLSLLMFCGGPPNKGTPADKRLKQNNPNAGKKSAMPKQPPMQKGMNGKKGAC